MFYIYQLLNKIYFQYKWQQKNGMHISFEHDNYQLIYPNGAVFNITQRGRLDYLKNIISTRNATYDLHNWHKILGHFNESDIKKLSNLVKGMEIKPTPNYALNCDICIQGKMSNDRNKTLDWKATKILALVNSDLAGHIQPLAKDGYEYVINFINDYSGLIMLHFLKHKSDFLLATTKYLADMASYGYVKCLHGTKEQSSLLNLLNSYLYLIESNTSSQLPILHIKMGPPNSHGKLYFLWQGVSLLSQNCPKTCGYIHWWFQCILEIIVIKNPQESFTGSKPNLYKMHIFGMTCFCYVQNKTKLDLHCEKGIFVGYDKQIPAYLIYFPGTTAIKRVRCIKFIDSYDNSSLSKPDENTENPKYLITYEVETEDNPKTEGEGQITHYPILKRKRPDFLVVENIEFGGVDYNCTLCTIPANTLRL